jgi:hypothetical protein
MRVGDEHMGYLEKVSGSKIPQVSEIKKNRASLIRKSDEKTWVSPRGID